MLVVNVAMYILCIMSSFRILVPMMPLTLLTPVSIIIILIVQRVKLESQCHIQSQMLVQTLLSITPNLQVKIMNPSQNNV